MAFDSINKTVVEKFLLELIGETQHEQRMDMIKKIQAFVDDPERSEKYIKAVLPSTNSKAPFHNLICSIATLQEKAAENEFVLTDWKKQYEQILKERDIFEQAVTMVKHDKAFLKNQVDIRDEQLRKVIANEANLIFKLSEYERKFGASIYVEKPTVVINPKPEFLDPNNEQDPHYDRSAEYNQETVHTDLAVNQEPITSESITERKPSASPVLEAPYGMATSVDPYIKKNGRVYTKEELERRFDEPHILETPMTGYDETQAEIDKEGDAERRLERRKRKLEKMARYEEKKKQNDKDFN